MEVVHPPLFFLFLTFCAHTRRPSARPPATAADVIRLTIFLLSSSAAATNNSLLLFFFLCVHVWPRKRMGSRRAARVSHHVTIFFFFLPSTASVSTLLLLLRKIKGFLCLFSRLFHLAVCNTRRRRGERKRRTVAVV